MTSTHHIEPLAHNESSEELDSLLIVDGEDEGEDNGETLGRISESGDRNQPVAQTGMCALKVLNEECSIFIQNAAEAK